jgi:hypothetical protein
VTISPFSRLSVIDDTPWRDEILSLEQAPRRRATGVSPQPKLPCHSPVSNTICPCLCITRRHPTSMVHPETLSGRGKYSLRPVLSYLGLVLLTLWRGERFRCKVYAPSFRESVYQTVQTGRSACQMQRRDVFLSARQLQTSWHRYRARSVYPSKGQSRAARTLIFPRRPDGSIDLGVRLRALLVVSQARQDHTIV